VGPRASLDAVVMQKIPSLCQDTVFMDYLKSAYTSVLPKSTENLSEYFCSLTVWPERKVFAAIY